MPRVRLTARGWLAAALFGAGVCALPALAAPARAGGRVGRKVAAPPAAGARPADAEARRREEIDALQRQDAADALKRHYNIDVDWRQTSLDRLIDIRVRAAKAADLQQRLGVSVDWQRYSWIELEALRRTLLSFEDYRNAEAPVAARAGAGGDARAVPAARRRSVWCARPSRNGRPARAGEARIPTASSGRPSPAASRRRPMRAIPTASSGRRSWYGRAGRRSRSIRTG